MALHIIRRRVKGESVVAAAGRLQQYWLRMNHLVTEADPP